MHRNKHQVLNIHETSAVLGAPSEIRTGVTMTHGMTPIRVLSAVFHNPLPIEHSTTQGFRFSQIVGFNFIRRQQENHNYRIQSTP